MEKKKKKKKKKKKRKTKKYDTIARNRGIILAYLICTFYYEIVFSFSQTMIRRRRKRKKKKKKKGKKLATTREARGVHFFNTNPRARSHTRRCETQIKQDLSLLPWKLKGSKCSENGY